MNKLHLSSNLYKQKSNPKMSHPFPQTKEKQDLREKNVQKKKKKERNEGKKLGRRIKARANSTSSP